MGSTMSKRFTASRVPDSGIDEGIARISHPLMPLIVELSRVVGEPHGGWVHWGATTQNITQTGDVLILRKVHKVVVGLLGRQAAQAAASQNTSFPDRLAADHRVTAHLSRRAIDALRDPASHTGFSARIAHEQVEVARRFAGEIHAQLRSSPAIDNCFA